MWVARRLRHEVVRFPSIHTFRRLHQGSVGQRHTHVLGLPAIDSVRGHRIPEELAFGAAACLAPDAVVAFLAGCVERNDHCVIMSMCDFDRWM